MSWKSFALGLVCGVAYGLALFLGKAPATEAGSWGVVVGGFVTYFSIKDSVQ